MSKERDREVYRKSLMMLYVACGEEVGLGLGLCLNVFLITLYSILILVVSCFMFHMGWCIICALYSYDLLLSYPTISLASHITTHHNHIYPLKIKLITL